MGEYGDKESSSSSTRFKQKSEQPTQPHHQNIDYNKDLEYLLKDNAEECESLGILHRASFEKYNRLSNYINIPVIILSSAIGFATGIDIGYEKMNIILGIGSIFVGIIKSIDTYFQLGKRSESHRLCSLQYQQVHKKIQIELALKRPQRQTAKDMMAVIKTDIKNLQDISPLIDQDIIDSYNDKYGKYTTVKKPNFVNGLTEVVVNSTTDGDSGDVLHSRSRSESVSLDGNESDGGENGGNGGGAGGGGGGRGGSFPTLGDNHKQDAVKIDAFGKGSGDFPFQNDVAASIKSTPSSPFTAMANLVFKKETVRDDIITSQNLNDSLKNLYELQQLQQLQRLQQLQQQYSAPLTQTSFVSAISATGSRASSLSPTTDSVQAVPAVAAAVAAAPTPPMLFQLQPPQQQLSARNSRVPSGIHTPNSEIIAITDTGNMTVELNENSNGNNNVVITVIPDENAYDGNGAMM
jgi:hypothetical protein